MKRQAPTSIEEYRNGTAEQSTNYDPKIRVPLSIYEYAPSQTGDKNKFRFMQWADTYFERSLRGIQEYSTFGIQCMMRVQTEVKEDLEFYNNLRKKEEQERENERLRTEYLYNHVKNE